MSSDFFHIFFILVFLLLISNFRKPPLLISTEDGHSEDDKLNELVSLGGTMKENYKIVKMILFFFVHCRRRYDVIS